MPTDRRLTVEQAASAVQIQTQIDAVAAAGGGRVLLPAMELVLDRGLALRSGVELVGQGAGTLLRKGPGRIYPLSGYHNYGMYDVPLVDASGLEVGMTVSVHDNRTHGGFFETFATITWIDGDWVGLDRGIEADYRAGEAPALTTVYPLLFGHRLRNAAVRDLRLEGNRAASDRPMGGCRGGAVYFCQSRGIQITGIRESGYDGEGLSFQMCRDVVIRDSQFDDNTGNGLHPGAGSTNALFERCSGVGNARSGFFFCVRANHITVRDGHFAGNGSGISIGTRDCHNLIDACRIEDNAGAGILVRDTPRPVEVHSCRVRGCRIAGNGRRDGRAQVEVTSDAHDLVIESSHIDGGGRGVGVRVAASARDVAVVDNHISACDVDVEAEPASLGPARPGFTCGYGNAPPEAYRHLPPDDDTARSAAAGR